VAKVRGPGIIAGAVLAAGQSTSQTRVIQIGTSRRLLIVINIASASGGTLQVTINGVSASGYVYPILSSLTLSSVAVTPLRVGPSLTPSSNAVANDLLPSSLQIVATATATIAYGIDYIAGL